MITFLSIIQSLSNTTVLTDTQVSTKPNDKDLILFRYYSTKTSNLWPRDGVDYDGLSFMAVPPKSYQYPYVFTSVDRLTKTGMFIVIPTKKKNHYLVIPKDGNIDGWMKDGEKSIYTKRLALAVTEVI